MTHGHSPAEVADRLSVPQRPGHLRDMIYGAIDGAVTTFALVSGVQGAGLSPTIIVTLGLANVLADGFSMAAANYSGTKADSDDRRRLRQIEAQQIADNPEGELAELRHILALKGLSGPVLDAAATAIARDHDNWIDLMLVDEYGLPPASPRPLPAALATFIAFLLAGLVPLVPYLFELTQAFPISIAVTGLVFFAIGTAKSRWSLAPWWRSGLETAGIGTIAATIAYATGAAVQSFVG
ncbi:MAG: hypothetical protein GKR99_11805 [Rhodobacteraceae bacterium]|nr:hypothetical protein [Paracoccaceae bacterium]